MNYKEYLAWQDGALDPAAQARFEASLTPEERSRAEEWRAIRQALREGVPAPPLEYPDFLNARILEEIRREENVSDRRRRLPSLRPLLAWGLGLMVAAAFLAAAWLPRERGLRSEEEFISQVIGARAGTPQMSVTAFPAPDRRGVVIWIEGADYIPPEQSVR